MADNLSARALCSAQLGFKNALRGNKRQTGGIGPLWGGDHFPKRLVENPACLRVIISTCSKEVGRRLQYGRPATTRRSLMMDLIWAEQTDQAWRGFWPETTAQGHRTPAQTPTLKAGPSAHIDFIPVKIADIRNVRR